MGQNRKTKRRSDMVRQAKKERKKKVLVVGVGDRLVGLFGYECGKTVQGGKGQEKQKQEKTNHVESLAN